MNKLKAGLSERLNSGFYGLNIFTFMEKSTSILALIRCRVLSFVRMATVNTGLRQNGPSGHSSIWFARLPMKQDQQKVAKQPEIWSQLLFIYLCINLLINKYCGIY